jgi:hypothetical protein
MHADSLQSVPSLATPCPPPYDPSRANTIFTVSSDSGFGPFRLAENSNSTILFGRQVAGRFPRPGMIDQHLPHRSRGDPRKITVLADDAGFQFLQLEEKLAHQRAGYGPQTEIRQPANRIPGEVISQPRPFE